MLKPLDMSHPLECATVGTVSNGTVRSQGQELKHMQSLSHTFVLVSCALAMRPAFAGNDESSTPDVAMEIGLTPTVLVVADASENATQILEALDGAVQLRANFDACELGLAEALSAVRATAATCGTLPDDIDARTDFEAAVVQANNARELFLAVQAELRAVALASLNSETRSAVNAARLAAGRAAPAEFGAVDRSEDEWRAIEIALVSEMRANQTGVAVESPHSETLSTARSAQPVAFAAQRLSVELPSVEAIYASWQ